MNFKKFFKKYCMILLIIVIVIAGLGSYLIIKNNKKENKIKNEAPIITSGKTIRTEFRLKTFFFNFLSLI